jgi:MFS family permease
MQKFKNDLAILIGNVLDHYDTHIYTLLAPYIAEVFFASDSPLISQIKAYGVVSIGLITRPLGAALFGRFASIIGPLKALRYSLMGVALSTFVIGLLPSYGQVGWISPILLIIFRALQSIFASGEGAIAGLYLVSSNPKRRNFFSSIYGMSTLFGLLLASKMAKLISQSSDPLIYWRVGFIFGFLTSIVGIYIRSLNYKTAHITLSSKVDAWTIIKTNKEKILRIGILNGFSYISYPVSFTIINAFLPLTKNVSIAEALTLNMYLVIFDGILIPISGYILKFVNISKFMVTCAIFLSFFLGLVLWILPTASVEEITFARVLLIMAGIPFSIALKIWVADVMDLCGEEKYLICALGGGLGMELLGRNITVLSLFLFNIFGNFILCIVYIFVLGLLAIYSICSYPKTAKNLDNLVKTSS